MANKSFQHRDKIWVGGWECVEVQLLKLAFHDYLISWISWTLLTTQRIRNCSLSTGLSLWHCFLYVSGKLKQLLYGALEFVNVLSIFSIQQRSVFLTQEAAVSLPPVSITSDKCRARKHTVENNFAFPLGVRLGYLIDHSHLCHLCLQFQSFLCPVRHSSHCSWFLSLFSPRTFAWGRRLEKHKQHLTQKGWAGPETNKIFW